MLYDVILPDVIFEEAKDTPDSDSDSDDERISAPAQENSSAVVNSANIIAKKPSTKKRKAVVVERSAHEVLPCASALSPPKFLTVERAQPTCPVHESVVDFVMKIISETGCETISKDLVLQKIDDSGSEVEKDLALQSVGEILVYLEKVNRIFFLDEENICIL